MSTPQSLERAIELTVREEWGRILASLTKSLGDLQLAEDCLQEAVLVAMTSWAKVGIPKVPSAWLLTTAKRKAIDRFRAIKVQFDKQEEISRLLDWRNEEANYMNLDHIPDKRLEMIFTCCHPALEEKTRVALTLRTLGGLTVDEIAQSFVDKPEALAQRLVRAKKKILNAGIPYQIPDKTIIQERLNSVLKVIYLIFNEGYAAKKGVSILRTDLSVEAIRLARLVFELLEKEKQPSAEAAGLLALMLLHDSRRSARINSDKQLVMLEFQNRSLWDQNLISEGCALVTNALKKQSLGPYQLQAAISALHSNAKTWAETDWPQIEALYQVLLRIQPNPIIRLNLAVAVSYSRSPKEAFLLLEEIEQDGALESYQKLHLVKSDLSKRIGQFLDAKQYLERALELTDNKQEHAFLSGKLDEIKSKLGRSQT